MANHFFQIYEQLPSYIVVTFLLSLRWMRGPPRTECEQKQHHVYMWREQAITEWSPRVNSIVACCHGAKPCAHAARAFRSQQNGAVTRTWRSCRVQPSQIERAIGAVRCKQEGVLLQHLSWRCAECATHHERNVREEQHHVYGANKK